ncbi:TadE/TadG family type IV pilus assembly protein [Bremerella sp. T1]|uniref:TadE/TadG family type IV pilus assembly protein n=1 Tax=Bremerella sp. TYQ1 TaxID=3119568 RepID=UPI001CC998E3|nr:TadE family protein [Bremerella volcania]UBM36146.1 pilus assembly protein [Bremerella volcania]
MVLFRKSKRRAASLLEIILGLPVVLILLFAVAQFGLLQSNQQTLKMASRAGALAAVELDINSGGPINPEIVNAVNEVLRRSGLIGEMENIAAVGDVQLDYFVYDEVNDTSISGTKVANVGCPPPDTTEPSFYYVQVTVCLPADRLAPNAMACFGGDFSGRNVIMTSLFRHEFSPVVVVP